MYTLLMIIHVIISVALILVILAQTSKGGLDANLGGAATNVLGSQGAPKFLKNATQILAVAFMASCLLMVFQVDQTKTVKASKAIDLMRKDAATQTEAPVQAAPQTENTEK